MTTATGEFAMAQPGIAMRTQRPKREPSLPLVAWLALLALGLLAVATHLREPFFALTALRDAGPASLSSLAGYTLSDPARIEFATRILHAARPSLAIGTGAAAIALLLGASIGFAASTRVGAIVGRPLLHALAALRAFPPLILAIVAVVVLGTGDVAAGTAVISHEVKLALMIGLLGAPEVAELAAAACRAERVAPWHVAEAALGAPPSQVVLRGVLRNCMGPVVACAVSLIGPAILCEASLSFLGLGVQPPGASWGGMVAAGYPALMAGEAWPALVPGAMILATACAFNLVGAAVRRPQDPRRIAARRAA